MSITPFLQEVETILKSGIATEHSYRAALQKLFDAVLAPATATNEPKHEAYGAPDFVIQQGNTPIGHVEAKDVGVALDLVVADSEREKPKTENGKQLRRYRAALPNLLYTDGLEWHWFVGGEARLQQPLRVATWDKTKKKLVASATATGDLNGLLQQFGSQQAATVGRPDDLARRLAQIARWLHDVIVEVFRSQGAQGELHIQLEAFRKTLLPTLKPDEFADMYAQTIVYGLFAARVAGPTKATFTRFDAAAAIPKTNPFLRKLFQEIAGYDLDDRIAWLVDDCAHLLERTDMEAVLRDFGKATRREDPVVHFYETFLAAYDPKLREARGVYYTPEPVVSFIVRSVDSLLQTRFNKPMGLADDKTIVLDPATGTSTFLHTVIQQIHATLQDQGLAGTWNQYVPQKLLPRVFGFELLMAPYTVAHLKLGLLLKELGYNFASNERLGVYLTNALEDAPGPQQTLAFAQYIAEEGQAANAVKHGKPVMVVLGNPPYSYESENTGKWIVDLVRDYYQVDGKPLNERNPKGLQDDYVKFIRFAQWRIDQTGAGVVAFICNHGYLDNPTFRGMRQSLMNSFDEIFIVNLHGNANKQERAPDGSQDENVFDIRQGVAIGIFVKGTASKNQPLIHYADLWGDRKGKYMALGQWSIGAAEWQTLAPSSPFYLFIPQLGKLNKEYNDLPNIVQSLPNNSPGIMTARDHLTIHANQNTVREIVQDFANIDVETARSKYDLGADSSDWQVDLAQKDVRSSEASLHSITTILYRPFDVRYTYYTGKARGFMSRPRAEIMRHMLGRKNLGLVSVRQVAEGIFNHVLVSDTLIDNRATSSNKGYALLLPLYLYPSAPGTRRQASLFEDAAEENSGIGGRRANLAPAFIAELKRKLDADWVSDGSGLLLNDERRTIGPEDVFHFAYAVFHSPTYRTRYAEFLKIDFPRLPLTSDWNLFVALAKKGAELVDLHLLRLPGAGGVGGNGGAAILQSPGKQGVTFPQSGTNTVDKVSYDATQERVVINTSQYFTGVAPETWAMRIGGYQPLDKWLKDRKNRVLTADEVLHYMRVVIALRETRRVMTEIDATVPAWPLG